MLLGSKYLGEDCDGNTLSQYYETFVQSESYQTAAYHCNTKLEGNCDFSSNNNVWIGFFYSFFIGLKILFLGYFYHDRLIGNLFTVFLQPF